MTAPSRASGSWSIIWRAARRSLRTKPPTATKTKTPVTRGGAEVALEAPEEEAEENEVADNPAEEDEVAYNPAQEAQEVPTPVDSRIAPKFDEFPDKKIRKSSNEDENDVPP